jgi:hypothetical protein
MSSSRAHHRLDDASVAEPRLHGHFTDALPVDHPLARRRVRCDRCGWLLHLQSNRCLRSWVESERGNFCLQCFILDGGSLAHDGTRLAVPDGLARDSAPAFRDAEASRWSALRSRRRARLRRHVWGR